MEIHIGLDDLDSPLGQCTTFVAFLISKEILEKGLGGFLDYPYLVRLDPNVPFKTRGNGSVSIHLKASPKTVGEILETARRIVDENYERHGKTSPTLVVLEGRIPQQLSQIYERALREFIPRKYVKELVTDLSDKLNLEIYPSTENRGLVGALAAIGAYPLRNFTYELLAYRDPYSKVPERTVPWSFFVEVDRAYRPTVFATYDYIERRPLAVPHGPDPVVFGLRSFDPRILENILKEASRRFPYSYMIFKTNQATNAHLARHKKISKLRPYDSALIEGSVAEQPRIMPGGHAKLVVADDTGEVQVMVYRETGRLNRLARLLRPGDTVEVGGGVVPRKGLTLNAEQIRLKQVSPKIVARNPKCPRCGATMKSAGRGKGFKCPKCGYRDRNARKIMVKLPRIVAPGLYVASPRAYRHLTRPPETFGLEGVDVFVEKWIFWRHVNL
ncbi:MAG: tRNA(Ile2) 2-agmatinylcytidine synthetase [Thermoprotei archaeon]|nr:MAG: tRNA(Ile2) 2-agmatinylcytidine synthetase [Thermoprotei archaeon]